MMTGDNQRLSSSFYEGDDVVSIAKELIGMMLCTYIDSQLCKAIITETEAYNGRTDRACHAFGGKRTKRTEVMYQRGGVAYIYLCYGIHELFNVVTNAEDMADAVLIRGVKPMEGLDVMVSRRGNVPTSRLSSGPGTLTKALGITREHNGSSLQGEQVWIEEGIEVKEGKIQISERIGIDYAGEDKYLKWRFFLPNDFQ